MSSPLIRENRHSDTMFSVRTCKTRPAVITYGMWDQVRVDHGKEFYLTLFMQEMLSHHRFNQERLPYLQTSSTRNHTVE
ncbi:hypothetical protein KOW79_018740 [Hemibagrus wyckioides]|uniref:Uncharacterized protein n=1 Tax=Hemibagrus wyckioides TaxID=337641 RepID=A0A9D3SBN6_9TELE|nr:hypothetical protein KOW79_018740 [Hemibagrus wyckioides]